LELVAPANDLSQVAILNAGVRDPGLGVVVHLGGIVNAALPVVWVFFFQNREEAVKILDGLISLLSRPQRRNHEVVFVGQ